jgi:DNA invertase Pin-like site-specific DNA recombinase
MRDAGGTRTPRRRDGTQSQKRLIGYARVSTFGQTLDSQLEQLRKAGCNSRNIYREKATGARPDRRELLRMLDKLAPGDVVTVTRIDRLARSTFDLFGIVKRIVDAKAQFRSLAEPWADTDTSTGRLMLAVLGGLADVERDLIRSRTAEGRSRAKAQGTHMCGRHHDVIDDDEEAYTVDRLLKMKADHEARAASIDEAFAERAARLLIDRSVRSENQSGGITAHTVHLNVSGLHSEPEQEKQRHAEKMQRQSDARRYLAPELNRTIARALYIHDRACAHFVCASAEHSIKPNDRKEDFIPHWPALYPNAPQCRDLAADDAAALIAYYDSLHSLADSVYEWWGRDDQLPVNIFNVFLHLADKSLELGLICIAKFEVEKLCPPPHEAWGTISSRIERSRASAANARKHHIARFEAKAKTPTALPALRNRHTRH